MVIDAGANVGMFTMYAARMSPAARILAIEPFPSTFERLSAAVASNKLNGVTCLNAALGKEAGEALMPAEEMGSQFRRVVTEANSAAVAVRVMTLGEALESSRIDRVDLLKMDIEGGEYPSLLFAPPGVLQRIRKICLEYHPAAESAYTIDRLTAHLRNNGFSRTFHRYDGEGYGMARFERN